MRIKVTKPGIYNSAGQEIAAGTELTVKKEPTGWAGRYETISASSEKKESVTNPTPEPRLVEVLALADGNFMSFKSAAKKVLGDATPDKKDEIVAALIDKLTDTELKTYLGSKGVEVKDETREQLVELAKAA